MRLTRSFCVAALVFCMQATTVCAQTPERHFPTDDEIRLVLTQAERAVNEYKPLLDRWVKQLGNDGAEAVGKDRETIHGIETGIIGFRKNPQAFNGPLGFAFFEWLDDACRNALLSSLSLSNTATVGLMNGDIQKAQANIELAKDFSNVSTMLYTVSENAGALYSRYSEGIEQVAELGAKTATECADILKKSKSVATKP